MAENVFNKVNGVLNEISAIQTLIENFPNGYFNYYCDFHNLNFTTSLDVIAILFKILGIDRDELIDKITDALCNGDSGFINVVEESVKYALEANISNIINCTTNPIINNDLLDSYEKLDIEMSGNGIDLNVFEIDLTGVLNRNPLLPSDKNFYFDIDEYNVSTIWKSKDFNAFLWYIINKSDKSQKDELIWDNRYEMSNNQGTPRKEIIRCTYVDEGYPNSDKIKVQICGARNKQPANYYKTRNILKENNAWQLNKTIFEFNHDFLHSIKLYDSKVIVAEIVENLLGTNNLSLNIGFSLNENIIQGKIQEIIKTVIETSDTEINDCYFSFSNEEFNNMLEIAEKNRFNVVNFGNNSNIVNPEDILANLSDITSNSSLIDDKSIISKTIYDISAIPAKDPMVEESFDANYDWTFELVRMFIYPFVRPIFSPKVMFLLLVNKKIMGNITETFEFDDIISGLLQSLFNIIRDVVVKVKDLIVDLLLNYILEELTSLLELFSSKLLLETLIVYKELLQGIIDKCILGWDSNMIVGNIDNVNYADITPKQVIPEQTIC